MDKFIGIARAAKKLKISAEYLRHLCREYNGKVDWCKKIESIWMIDVDAFVAWKSARDAAREEENE